MVSLAKSNGDIFLQNKIIKPFMSKKKCKTDKKKELKPSHQFECTKCGYSAKKKDKLCKPEKLTVIKH